jgi:hypothetical protein
MPNCPCLLSCAVGIKEVAVVGYGIIEPVMTPVVVFTEYGKFGLFRTVFVSVVLL